MNNIQSSAASQNEDAGQGVSFLANLEEYSKELASESPTPIEYSKVGGLCYLLKEPPHLPSRNQLTVNVNLPQPPSPTDLFSQRPVASSAYCESGAYGGENLCNVPHLSPESRHLLLEKTNTNNICDFGAKQSREVAHTNVNWTSSMNEPNKTVVPSMSVTQWSEVNGSQIPHLFYQHQFNPIPPSFVDKPYQHVTSLVSDVPRVNDAEKLFFPPPSTSQNDYQICIDDANTNPELSAVYSEVATHPSEKLPSTIEVPAERNVTSASVSQCLTDGSLNSSGMISRRERKYYKPYECKWQFCGISYRDYRCFCNHVQIHKGEKTYLCYICFKQFLQVNHLSQHLRTHKWTDDDMKIYRSSLYFKPENSRQDERIGPSRAHPRKLFFRCYIPSCGKTFEKFEFHVHMLEHADGQPFVCNWMLCTEKFTNMDIFEIHLSIHAGVKQFTCPVCRDRFTHLDILKHLKTHYGTL